MEKLIWLIIIIIFSAIGSSMKKQKEGSKRVIQPTQMPQKSWEVKTPADMMTAENWQQTQKVAKAAIEKSIKNLVPEEMRDEARKYASNQTYTKPNQPRNTGKNPVNPYANAGKNQIPTEAFEKNIIGKNVMQDIADRKSKATQIQIEWDMEVVDLKNLEDKYSFPQVKMEENLMDVESILTCGYYPQMTFPERDYYGEGITMLEKKLYSTQQEG